MEDVHAHEWLYFAKPVREGTQISENYVNRPPIQRALLEESVVRLRILSQWRSRCET